MTFVRGIQSMLIGQSLLLRSRSHVEERRDPYFSVSLPAVHHSALDHSRSRSHSHSYYWFFVELRGGLLFTISIEY